VAAINSVSVGRDSLKTKKQQKNINNNKKNNNKKNKKYKQS
jgi:hypothetical protein